jgi:hypothetical protein
VGQGIGRNKNKKGNPEEGNPLGQWIGSSWFCSIELGGSIGLDGRCKPDGGRALDLVENLNEEMGFGEESWEEISGDTLGDVG